MKDFCASVEAYSLLTGDSTSMIVDIDVGSLSSELLVKNFLLVYIVSFVSWAGLSYKAGARQVTFVELIPHLVLILMLGQMVVKMQGGENTFNLGSEVSVSFVTIIPLVCTIIGIFLLGISVGKSVQANKVFNTIQADGANNKKISEGDLKKLQLKAKPKTHGSTSPVQAPSIAESIFAGMHTPKNGNGVSDSSHSSRPTSTGRIERAQLATHVAEFAQNSEVERSAMDLTTDLARQTIFAIVGLPGVGKEIADQYQGKSWSLLHSDSTSFMWSSKDIKNDGILLRGSSYTKLSTGAVLQWLENAEALVGFEGLSHGSEVQFRTIESGTKNGMTVRRLVCNSGSVMRSKRDFIVISCVSTLDDGTHIISSRSFEQDFELPNKKRKDKRGYIRGVVHGAGYILHPWKGGDGVESGCEISFACHLNMMGAGHTNQTRMEPLAKSVITNLSRLQAVGNDPKLAQDLESWASDDGNTFSDEEELVKSEQDSQKKQKQKQKADDGNRSRLGSALDPSFGSSQKQECITAGTDAWKKLKLLHAKYVRGTKADKADSKSNEGWEVFSSDNGVTVRELTQASDFDLGVLSASCPIDAPPHVVRKLLVEQPGAVDALLEGRAVLDQVDDRTYIQYLAYGSIWPVGARDFLLVTTEDVYDSSSKTGDGFVIASTSIDHICDIEGGEEIGLDKSYSRSTIKLAGYVGVLNANGGTDLVLFVDVGIAASVPSWLLQMLASYGLSEMLQRIQKATAGAEIAPSHFELAKILNQIQTREEKRRSINKDSMSPLSAAALASLEQGDSQGSSSGNSSKKDQEQKDKDQKDWGSHRSSITEGVFESIKEADGLTSPRSTEESSSSVVESKTGTSGTNSSSTTENFTNATAPKRAPQPYDEHIAEFESVKKESLVRLRTYLGLIPDTFSLGLDWQEKANKNGVRVIGTQVNGSTWSSIQGDCMIKSSKQNIIDLVRDDNRTGEYDDMYDKFEFIHQLDDETSLRLIQMKGIWPTAPREFLMLSSIVDLEDGSSLIFSRSVNESVKPQTKSYVRGFIQTSGFYIQPYSSFKEGEAPVGLEPGMCKVILCAHTELGGSLPSSVVNQLSTGAPVKILEGIKGVLSRSH